MPSIRERLRRTDGGFIVFQATAREFFELDRMSGQDDEYNPPAPGAEDAAMNYSGIIIVCKDLEKLKEIQLEQAHEELREILAPFTEEGGN